MGETGGLCFGLGVICRSANYGQNASQALGDAGVAAEAMDDLASMVLWAASARWGHRAFERRPHWLLRGTCGKSAKERSRALLADKRDVD